MSKVDNTLISFCKTVIKSPLNTAFYKGIRMYPYDGPWSMKANKTIHHSINKQIIKINPTYSYRKTIKMANGNLAQNSNLASLDHSVS